MSADPMPDFGPCTHSSLPDTAAVNRECAVASAGEQYGSRCLPSTPKLYTLRGACAVRVNRDIFPGDRQRRAPERHNLRVQAGG